MADKKIWELPIGNFTSTTQIPVGNSNVTQYITGLDIINNVTTTLNLATVAFSGDYNDLLNIPPTFSGSYTDLTNIPNFATVAFSGNYTDLINIPTFNPIAFSGDYNDLINTPIIPTVPTVVSAFTNDSGYLISSDLSTVAFSGDYNDLINKPTIAASVWRSSNGTNSIENYVGNVNIKDNSLAFNTANSQIYDDAGSSNIFIGSDIAIFGNSIDNYILGSGVNTSDLNNSYILGRGHYLGGSIGSGNSDMRIFSNNNVIGNTNTQAYILSAGTTLGDNTGNVATIGGNANTINSGLNDTVIVGGSGITATQSNYVYTPNIQNIGKTTTSTLQVTTNAAVGRIPVSDASGNLTLTDYQPSVVPGVTQINNSKTQGSGNYYSPIANGNGYSAAGSIPANALLVSPFILTEDITINSLSFEVMLAGTTALIGIYELDGNKLPSNPVVQSTLLSVSTLGLKTYTLASPYTLLKNKWYGLAVLPTNNFSLRAPNARNILGGSITSAIYFFSYRSNLTPGWTNLPTNPTVDSLSNLIAGIFWSI